MLPEAVQVAAAEGQRAKVLVDRVEQLARTAHAQRHRRGVHLARVVRAVAVVHHDTAAGRAERLDRKVLALLHLHVEARRRDDRHRLAAVDAVALDVVSVQVAHTLHLVRLAVRLKLVRLHHLLHGGTDVAQPHVDTRRGNACVGRLLDRRKQRVPRRLKVQRERTVHDAALDLDTKVHLEHIRRLQHTLVAGVRRVVRRDLVQTHTGRETDAALEAVLLDQRTRAVLDEVRNLGRRHAGADGALCVLTHLAVHLGRTADQVVVVALALLLDTLALTQLLGRDALALLRELGRVVLLDLAHGEHAAREHLGEPDGRRLRLLHRRLARLLLLFVLVLVLVLLLLFLVGLGRAVGGLLVVLVVLLLIALGLSLAHVLRRRCVAHLRLGHLCGEPIGCARRLRGHLFGHGCANAQERA